MVQIRWMVSTAAPLLDLPTPQAEGFTITDISDMDLAQVRNGAACCMAWCSVLLGIVQPPS